MDRTDAKNRLLGRTDLPGLLFGFLCTLLFWIPLVIRGRMLFFMDFDVFYYANRLVSRLAIHNGELPLWNPYSLCGTPHAACWHPAVYYPVSLLYIVLPFNMGIMLFTGIHFFIAFVCTYLAAAYVTRSPLIRTLAALAFTFCGATVSTVDSLNTICSMAYMPLILALWWRYMETGTVRHFAATVAVASLQILAGGPEIVLVTWLALGLLTLGGVIDGPKRWRPPLLFAAAGTLTFLVCGIQLIPFLELYGRSARAAGFMAAQGGQWVVRPLMLLRLVAPSFATFPDRESVLYDGTQFWLKSYYAGSAVVFFALAALCRKRSGKFYALAAAALLGIVLAAGRSLPTWHVIKHLPFVPNVRYPAKFIILTNVALVLMACHGAADWLRLETWRKRSVWIAGVCCVIAGLAAALVCINGLTAGRWLAEATGNPQVAAHPDLHFALMMSAITGMAGLCGRLALLTTLLLLGRLALSEQSQRWRATAGAAWLAMCTVFFVWHAASLIHTRPAIFYEGLPRVWPTRRDTGRIAVNRAALEPFLATPDGYAQTPDCYRYFPMPNFHVAHGIRSLNGFLPVIDNDTHARLQAMEALMARDRAWYRYGFFRFAAVSTVYDHPGTPRARIRFDSERFSLRRELPYVYRRSGGIRRGRVFRIDDGARHPAGADLRHLFSKQYRPDTEVLFDGEWRSGVSRPVALKEDSFNRTVYDCGKGEEALLVTADSYDPGWRAVLDDGTVLPVLRANGSFRAVKLPAGVATVTFTYRPASFRWGLAASGAGVLAWIAMVVWGWRRPRPRL